MAFRTRKSIYHENMEAYEVEYNKRFMPDEAFKCPKYRVYQDRRFQKDWPFLKKRDC